MAPPCWTRARQQSPVISRRSQLLRAEQQGQRGSEEAGQPVPQGRDDEGFQVGVPAGPRSATPASCLPRGPCKTGRICSFACMTMPSNVNSLRREWFSTWVHTTATPDAPALPETKATPRRDFLEARCGDCIEPEAAGARPGVLVEGHHLVQTWSRFQADAAPAGDLGKRSRFTRAAIRAPA